MCSSIENLSKKFTWQFLTNQTQSNSSVSFLTRFIATGFFSGYSPFAPGTAGSFIGLLLYFIPGFEHTLTLSIIITFTFVLGTFVSSKMEKQFGDDPSIVVIDEVVGMWISLLFLPKTLLVAVLAFFLFRAHDIVKIPPARQLEAVPNGFGIMLDDVVAGIYANVSVKVSLVVLEYIGLYS
ncbi:MAG: phosphatidylglycerophosphatase A [Ignavibacteriales bacterium]|nr:phosphatidylglycerophosphatase A [Ignavibacteriales bacterium]